MGAHAWGVAGLLLVAVVAASASAAPATPWCTDAVAVEVHAAVVDAGTSFGSIIALYFDTAEGTSLAYTVGSDWTMVQTHEVDARYAATSAPRAPVCVTTGTHSLSCDIPLSHSTPINGTIVLVQGSGLVATVGGGTPCSFAGTVWFGSAGGGAYGSITTTRDLTRVTMPGATVAAAWVPIFRFHVPAAGAVAGAVARARKTRLEGVLQDMTSGVAVISSVPSVATRFAPLTLLCLCLPPDAYCTGPTRHPLPATGDALPLGTKTDNAPDLQVSEHVVQVLQETYAAGVINAATTSWQAWTFFALKLALGVVAAMSMYTALFTTANTPLAVVGGLLLRVFTCGTVPLRTVGSGYWRNLGGATKPLARICWVLTSIQSILVVTRIVLTTTAVAALCLIPLITWRVLSFPDIFTVRETGAMLPAVVSKAFSVRSIAGLCFTVAFVGIILGMLFLLSPGCTNRGTPGGTAPADIHNTTRLMTRIALTVVMASVGLLVIFMNANALLVSSHEVLKPLRAECDRAAPAGAVPEAPYCAAVRAAIDDKQLSEAQREAAGELVRLALATARGTGFVAAVVLNETPSLVGHVTEAHAREWAQMMWADHAAVLSGPVVARHNEEMVWSRLKCLAVCVFNLLLGAFVCAYWFADYRETSGEERDVSDEFTYAAYDTEARGAHARGGTYGDLAPDGRDNAGGYPSTLPTTAGGLVYSGVVMLPEPSAHAVVCVVCFVIAMWTEVSPYADARLRGGGTPRDWWKWAGAVEAGMCLYSALLWGQYGVAAVGGMFVLLASVIVLTDATSYCVAATVLLVILIIGGRLGAIMDTTVGAAAAGVRLRQRAWMILAAEEGWVQTFFLFGLLAAACAWVWDRTDVLWGTLVMVVGGAARLSPNGLWWVWKLGKRVAGGCVGVVV